MAYSIVRVNKMKTQEHFERSMEHNFRLVPVSNADPAKAHLNKTLVEMKEKDYLEAYYSRINNSSFYKTRKVRKDAVKGVEVMLTCSGEVNPKLFEQKRWEAENVKWLQGKFGVENVVSVVAHYDESSPHIHAIVVPLVNGSLNAKYYTGGKPGCSKLQTEYAKAMESLGLERGLARTGATHTEMKRFQSSVHKAANRELPFVEVGESVHDYRERANEYHRDSHLAGLAKIEKEKRETQKARAALADTKDKLAAANEELNALKVELERRKELDETAKRKADRMDLLLNGIRNGGLSSEKRAWCEDMIKRIYLEGFGKSPEEMSVEKKALLMDELLAGITGGSMPYEERIEFNETIKKVAEWEAEREVREAEEKEKEEEGR